MNPMRWLAAAAAAVACCAAPLRAQVAQEKVDLAVVQRIRDEGMSHSQIPALAHHLMDVIGPRLTGSRAIRQANEWTAAQLRAWGATNVVVEARGEFGRGWENVSANARMLEPFVAPLFVEPLAWTGSTRGTVRGPVVLVQADSLPDLAKYAGKLKGAFVLWQPPPKVEPEWSPPAVRRTADGLMPTGPRPRPPGMTFEQMWAQVIPTFLRQDSVRHAMAAAGALAIVVPSRRGYGLLEVDADYFGMDPKHPIGVPELVLSQEQYGPIWRDVDGGVPVRLEASVQSRFYADDTQGHNTLGDIAGSDLADQYVMLGGHLDSWHSGTGATDDGAGTVVMLEAMRILRALDLRPRRTIRIGLWDGEEQGLLGSRGWVARHPELLPKISAYVNVDNGAGRIRGVCDQWIEGATPVFEQTLWPFRDLGVVAVRHCEAGGVDSQAFDAAGVPAFNFTQDPLDYGSKTHHSNVDTYERLPMDDLKQAAVVVAATVWELANRDEPMPRSKIPPAEKAAPSRP